MPLQDCSPYILTAGNPYLNTLHVGKYWLFVHLLDFLPNIAERYLNAEKKLH